MPARYIVVKAKTATFYCGPEREGQASILATVDICSDVGTMDKPTFEWVGDPSWPVSIDFNCEHLIERMPWPMEKLTDSGDWRWSMSCKYIRLDGAYGYAYQRFHHDWWRMLYALEKIGALLILTAELWGWAKVPRGSRPGIKHLGRR